MEPDVETFHPIHARAPGAWFPGDHPTSLLIAIQHAWEDMKRLIEIRRTATQSYDQNLLLKYVFMEIYSLINLMDELHGHIMKAEVYQPGEKRPYRGISAAELEIARSLWKPYHQEKSRVQERLTAIRHKVVAHRNVSDWQLIRDLHDAIKPDLILGVAKTMPPAFEQAKDLNIYEWNRRPEPGVIEVLGGRIELDGA